MITETASKIEEYIRVNKQATAKDLASYLGITPQALFRQLAKLQAKGKVYKVGSPPRVYYFVKEEPIISYNQTDRLDTNTRAFIEKNFLVITPSGERKTGLDGFAYWCHKTKQPLEKTAEEYIKTVKKYHEHSRNGVINATDKLKKSFGKSYVDRLYYLDFYSIERFGKTRLGQILLYAKQSQNTKLMKELVDEVQPTILQVVKKWEVDGIGFIPPTVKRQVQFMKELERLLHLKLKRIPIIKLKTEISVPQKTLSKIGDRIENAQRTFVVDDKNHYKNILLIDDAVGSGATINETAAKIRAKKLCSGKIIGLSITGSYKGFEVISEV